MTERVIALLAIMAVAPACVGGLHPRTTLDGSAFNATEVGAVRVGLAESQVRAILGEPFEVTTDRERTTWRYYEQFTPRGCYAKPPVIAQEFRVAFVAGRVVSTEPVTQQLPN